MEGTSLEDAYAFQAWNFQGVPQQQQQKDAPSQQQAGAGARRSTPLNQLQQPQQNALAVVEQQSARGPVQAQRPRVDYQMVAEQAPVVTNYLPPGYPSKEAMMRSGTYYDAMVNKRKDVLKMVCISVIILLAISCHNVVDFGLKEFIMNNDFSFKQELGVRMIYPAVVLFLLWNIKAMR